jgi:hypothetical protein
MRITWKDSGVIHMGQLCGIAHDSDSDITRLVVACEDGRVRRVNIDDIPEPKKAKKKK